MLEDIVIDAKEVVVLCFSKAQKYFGQIVSRMRLLCWEWPPENLEPEHLRTQLFKKSLPWNRQI